MREIYSYVLAGYPAIHIRTSEQERVFEYVLKNLKDGGLGDLNVMVWKCTTGLFPVHIGETGKVADDFFSSLQYITGGTDNRPVPDTVFVFFNIKEFLKIPGNVQQLRDAAYAVRGVGSYLIFIGPDTVMPPEVEEMVTTVDFDLPTKDELVKLFNRIVERNKEQLGISVSPSDIDTAADNAKGLTAMRAENAISLSLTEAGKVDLNILREEKRQMLKQVGALEVVTVNETMDSLGGFGVLKEHVKYRSKYFKDLEGAKEFGIIQPPKGILLVGLPGTGKTTAAKCIASALNLPLYKFDIGSLFKGTVGASEAEVRKVLKIAEAVAPATLLLDEMEKAMAGLESSGRSDSGTTSRVIGYLMSWMSETEAPLYKVAACNTLTNLNPALMRRGRWDTIFAVDLPTGEEIEEIYAIHLAKRGKSPSDFDLKKLREASSGFVGAEIEGVLNEAFMRAFSDGVEVTTDLIMDVCKEVIPISVTSKEEIDTFRKWVKNRAQSVSSSKSVSVKGRSTGRVVRSSGGGGDTPPNIDVSDIIKSVPIS